MTATSLIIVADRGSLRAYRVEETPTRGPHLELVQAFEVTDVMDAASTRHEHANDRLAGNWKQRWIAGFVKNSPPRSRKS